MKFENPEANILTEGGADLHFLSFLVLGVFYKITDTTNELSQHNSINC
jgi:hypothetical protein